MAITEQIIKIRKKALIRLVLLGVLFVVMQLSMPVLQQQFIEESFQLELDRNKVHNVKDRLVDLERLAFNLNELSSQKIEPRLRNLRTQFSLDQKRIESFNVNQLVLDSLALNYLNFNSALTNLININQDELNNDEVEAARLKYLKSEAESYNRMLNRLDLHLEELQKESFNLLQTTHLIHVILNLLLFVLGFLVVQKPLFQQPKKLVADIEELYSKNQKITRELEVKKKQILKDKQETKELEKDLRIAKSSVYQNVKMRESLKSDIDFLASGIEKQVSRPVKSIINLANWTIEDKISKLSIEANKNQNLILARGEKIIEYAERFKQYVSFNKSSGPTERINTQLLISEIVSQLNVKRLQFSLEGKAPVLIADKESIKDVLQKTIQVLISSEKITHLKMTSAERIDFAQFKFVSTYSNSTEAKNVYANLTFENGSNYINQLNIALIKKKVNAVNGKFSLEQISNENLSITFTWPFEV